MPTKIARLQFLSSTELSASPNNRKMIANIIAPAKSADIAKAATFLLLRMPMATPKMNSRVNGCVITATTGSFNSYRCTRALRQITAVIHMSNRALILMVNSRVINIIAVKQ